MEYKGAAADTGVLVVEDDPAIGRAVTRALTRAGYPVLLARRCRSALQLNGSFELAVVDLDLPDGNGVELAEQLLGAGRTRAVVFYSASADAVRLARASELGEVVPKAAELEKLLDAVTRTTAEPVRAVAARAASSVRR